MAFGLEIFTRLVTRPRLQGQKKNFTNMRDHEISFPLHTLLITTE